MAQPITWRNVNSDFDISGASAALARAGQSINSGFNGFEDIIRNQQQVNADNRQIQIDNSTQDFLNKLGAYNPAQLEQAISDGTVEQLRNSYDVRLNPTKTNGAALQELLQSRRNQVTAGQEFTDQQAARDSIGLQNQINDLLNKGDIDSATSLISKLPANLQAEFANRSDVLGDTQTNNQFTQALLNKDFDAAQKLRNQLSKDRDVSDLDQQLANGKQKFVKDTILAAAKDVPNAVKYAELEQQKAAKDWLSSRGYEKVEDLKNSKEAGEYLEFLNQFDDVNQTDAFNKQVRPLLNSYLTEFGYDPELENALKLVNEGNAANGNLLPADQARINTLASSTRDALLDSGNPYVMPDSIGLRAQEKIDLNAAAKINPDIQDLDAGSKEMLAKGLGAINNGITLSTKDGKKVSGVPVPAEVLQRALLGIDSGVLRDTDLPDIIEKLMKEGSYADKWIEARQFEKDVRRLTNEARKASGVIPEIDKVSEIQKTLQLKESLRTKEDASKANEAEAGQKFLNRLRKEAEQKKQSERQAKASSARDTILETERINRAKLLGIPTGVGIDESSTVSPEEQARLNAIGQNLKRLLERNALR